MNTLKNSVQLIGHLGIAPTLKTLSNGNQVVNMTMATTERFLSKGIWNQDTQWHKLVIWGKLAAHAEKQLRKGAHVCVKGKITYRSYITPDGETKYVTEIVVYRFVLLEGKNKTAAPQAPVTTEGRSPF